jgi:hypothetical protein
MTDKTDETGKGPYRPGDAPKRPSATIDVAATEIGKERAAAGAPRGMRPESKGGPLPLPKPDALTRSWAVLTGMLFAAWSFGLSLARNNTFLSHAAAGAAGAVLTLAVTGLLGLLSGGSSGERVPIELGRRLAAVEKAQQQRPALPGDLASKLTGAETRLARLEEQVQAAQAKVAADAKAIGARMPAADLGERVAKLEAALASLSADDRPGSAKLADMEKLVGEASAAKAASARVDQDIARVKGEAQNLRQSLEALKASLDERLKDAAKAGDIAPLVARLTAFERDLHGVLTTEGARTAGAQQVLLALEIASLKRALDRGDSYARELDAVRKTAAGSIDLAVLERDSRAGVPTPGALAQQFRRTADAAVDAEREQADASVIDRLMAGARSIVRWRRAGYDADDTSVEAVLDRMESALKDGHLAEALAQGKRLPPKAARAAEGWLRKLEARTAADRAIADIETALKSSLAGGRPPAPEGTR